MKKIKLLFIFLWRQDPTSSVVVHHYTRRIFVARDSPTCANSALQTTASDHQAEYPEAASAVVQKFYVDDYVDFFQNRDDALKLACSSDKSCQQRARRNNRS